MSAIRPRCEAQVNRYQGGGMDDAAEAEYAPEPCGRLSKRVVRVGNRDVQTCEVHGRRLDKLAHIDAERLGLSAEVGRG